MAQPSGGVFGGGPLEGTGQVDSSHQRDAACLYRELKPVCKCVHCLCCLCAIFNRAPGSRLSIRALGPHGRLHGPPQVRGAPPNKIARPPIRFPIRAHVLVSALIGAHTHHSMPRHDGSPAPLWTASASASTQRWAIETSEAKVCAEKQAVEGAQNPQVET
jgi:hypothetical protein